MKKLERIFGILTIVLFWSGLIFKYQLIAGGSVLISTSLPVFVFGYLIPHYSLQRRKSITWPEQVYLILKFTTYSLVLTSAIMIIMHWAGGDTLIVISMILVACQIVFYIYMRAKGSKRFSSTINDMVVGVLVLGIFFYFENPRASKDTLYGQSLILDQYEKQNAGIESVNRLIYESIDSIEMDQDPALKEGIGKIRAVSSHFYQTYDSITRRFIYYCNTPYANDRKISDQTLYPLVLHSGVPGEAFFISMQNGSALKSAIEAYMIQVKEIVQEYNLPAGLIGVGLNVDNIRDEYGNHVDWEFIMFNNQRASLVMSNLLWIKQMALRTENTVLNGLISRVDFSEEMKFLQTLAARESQKAMSLKENEIIRIRQEQELQTLQLEQSETALQQRKVTIIFAFLGIAFVLILLVISTRAFYLKRRDNKRLALHEREILQMNDALNQRNEEIMAQNDEILAQRDEIEAQRDMVYKQKDVIERSHGEISSSIEYAKRLQASILPSPGLLKTRIRDHFVLFMPKHRVSGDFYWWTQIEDHVVITAADCTGHGVPGAFMSMLGVSMLREIVSKEYISHPGVILRRLRKEVMHALKQTGELGEQKDGMDMALVSINVETLECQYAGANNPLYLVRHGELTEFKADRMPISIHQQMDKFKTHDIQLQKGDHLYMFSDGYADQFGGPNDKKFKYKAFRQMLLDGATQPMTVQKRNLDNTFREWKGERDQVDDVVVVGLAI